LAVKLKEKGFNIPFYFYYRTDDKFLRHANVTNPLVYCDKIDDEVVIAPTISQVLKWQRENNIHLYTDIDKEGWFFEIKCLKTRVMINTDFFKRHSTCELAALAGIKYVIDNLI
jgi:hypothetical protein